MPKLKKHSRHALVEMMIPSYQTQIMKTTFVFIVIAAMALALPSCQNGHSPSAYTTHSAKAKSTKSKTPETPVSVRVYPLFEDLAPAFAPDDDSLYVINFWSTYCPPCIKEMPHFIHLQDAYRDKKLKIILVSLDNPRDLQSRVIPFVQKHHITPKTVLLADDNYTKWTEKIDTSWYGALPATLLLHGTNRKFRFGAYQDYPDLEKAVMEVMKK